MKKIIFKMKNTWRFNGNEKKYLMEVISGDMISSTSGNMNQRFEQAFAKFTNTQFAITFNSGTSTLHAALHACNVNAGDEVIIPPITVISNVDVIFARGAIPIFCDVDKDTWNMDPLEVEKKITKKTKAIMPVSLYGLSASLYQLKALSIKYKIPIINDAAEAYGATCDGVDINELADITSYSLENSKHLTTGDGGIVVTNSEKYAISMRKFGSLSYSAMKAGDGRIRLNKEIFQDPAYSRHDDIGLNYRMPEVAAALGLAQVERAEYFIQKRINNAQYFREVVKTCNWLVEQKIPKGYRHTYWTYVIKLERDDITWKEFKDKFNEFGGDGPFGCWKITYQEDLFVNRAFERFMPNIYSGIEYPNENQCKISENIQPYLLQFATNQGEEAEVKKQADALQLTIAYYEK